MSSDSRDETADKPKQPRGLVQTEQDYSKPKEDEDNDFWIQQATGQNNTTKIDTLQWIIIKGKTLQIPRGHVRLLFNL